MFYIEDGREHFYQWDLDRRLVVEDETIKEVHFCNRTGECSLVCEVYFHDNDFGGVYVVNVPNILLQSDWKIHVFAWDGKHTRYDACYEVKSRTKPADYIYTETEIFTVEKAVKEEVERAIEEDVEKVVAVEVEKALDEETEKAVEEALKDKLNLNNLQDGQGNKSLVQLTPDEKLYSTATKDGAVAFGAAQRVVGDYGMAANFNNKVYAKHGFAINSGNTIEATAEGAFVAGHGNVAVKSFQTVLGNYAEVAEDDIFAVGSGNSNYKRTSLRVNRNDGLVTVDNFKAHHSNVTSQSTKHAYNDYTQTDELNVTKNATIGNAVFTKTESQFNPNEVTAEGCMAFGGSNTINGRNGVTLLTSNTIPEGCESVFIAGHKNVANSQHQYILGTYSTPNPDTKDLFIIGNGYKEKDGTEKRNNALVVRRDGNLIIGGNTITIGNTSITEAQLKQLLAMLG